MTVEINGGTFTSAAGNALLKIDVPKAGNNEIIIKGGTFNGISFENLTEEIIRGFFASGTYTIEKTNGYWSIKR